MNNRVWQYHANRIQTEEIAPIWVSVLNMIRSPIKRFGFASMAANKDLTVLQSQRFVEKLLYELKGQNKERKDMDHDSNIPVTMSDDMEVKLKDLFNQVDHTIEKLITIASSFEKYKQIIDSTKPVLKPQMPACEQEIELLKLGLVFLETARWNDVETAKTFIDEGFPINFQHPMYKNTILHVAASYNGISEIANMLMDTKKCNYLLLDASKRLACDKAYEIWRDHDAAERLRTETEAYAQNRNIGDVQYKYERGF